MFWKYNWPAIFWAGVIWLLCSIPGSDLPNIGFWENLGVDKVIHAGIFFILSFLAGWGFSKQNTFALLARFPMAIALVMCIIYGGFMEIFQGTVFQERTADGWDFAANTAGCLAGMFAYRKVVLR